MFIYVLMRFGIFFRFYGIGYKPVDRLRRFSQPAGNCSSAILSAIVKFRIQQEISILKRTFVDVLAHVHTQKNILFKTDLVIIILFLNY